MTLITVKSESLPLNKTDHHYITMLISNVISQLTGWGWEEMAWKMKPIKGVKFFKCSKKWKWFQIIQLDTGAKNQFVMSVNLATSRSNVNPMTVHRTYNGFDLQPVIPSYSFFLHASTPRFETQSLKGQIFFVTLPLFYPLTVLFLNTLKC